MFVLFAAFGMQILIIFWSWLSISNNDISLNLWLFHKHFLRMNEIVEDKHLYINTALEVFWDETIPLVGVIFTLSYS